MSDNGKEEQIPRDDLIQKEQPKTKEALKILSGLKVSP